MTHCKIQTYIGTSLDDYLRSRYDSKHLVRVGVLPFSVPETFAQPRNESDNFGRFLARNFKLELGRKGEFPIVEMFNVDRWPGRREQFFAGNHGAIKMARELGYDLVFVGYMEDIRNDEELDLYTKLIDTASGVTLWNARTMSVSKKRMVRRTLASVQIGNDRPELFYFTERAEEAARCTVDGLFKTEG